MKSSLIVIFAFCLSVSAVAQGIHLTADDTFSFGFNSVGGCHFAEGAPGAAVNVIFGSDLLGPGESLRLEMFENTLADQPFASQIFSPATATSGINLDGPASHWLDDQGLIQVTMLGCSVDVLGAHFFLSPNPNAYCDTVVAVPEPTPSVLISLSGIAVTCVRLYLRRRQQGPMQKLPDL